MQGFMHENALGSCSARSGIPLTIRRPRRCGSRVRWCPKQPGRGGSPLPPPDRYQARLQVSTLDYQGWDKVSISRFLPMARTTIDRWIRRFEAEHVAGLLDHKRGPKEPPRNVWLPCMVHVYRLQKAHPDAGEFRLGSGLAPPDIPSARSVG